jgi:hypothetical protein
LVNSFGYFFWLLLLVNTRLPSQNQIEIRSSSIWILTVTLLRSAQSSQLANPSG